MHNFTTNTICTTPAKCSMVCEGRTISTDHDAAAASRDPKTLANCLTLSLNNLPGYFQVVVVSLFSKGVTMVVPALVEPSTMVVSRPAPTVAVVPVCVDCGHG